MQYINIRDVIVLQYHWAIKPWALERLKLSIKDHGYKVAYPITLDGENTLKETL